VCSFLIEPRRARSLSFSALAASLFLLFSLRVGGEHPSAIILNKNTHIRKNYLPFFSEIAYYRERGDRESGGVFILYMLGWSVLIEPFKI